MNYYFKMQFSYERSFIVNQFSISHIEIDAITKIKFIIIILNDINDNINNKAFFFKFFKNFSRSTIIINIIIIILNIFSIQRLLQISRFHIKKFIIIIINSIFANAQRIFFIEIVFIIITFSKSFIFNLIVLLIKINNFKLYESHIYKKIIMNILNKMN